MVKLQKAARHPEDWGTVGLHQLFHVDMIKASIVANLLGYGHATGLLERILLDWLVSFSDVEKDPRQWFIPQKPTVSNP